MPSTSTTPFLKQVTAAKQAELPLLKQRFQHLRVFTKRPTLSHYLLAQRENNTPVQLICELKPASPSQGKLQQENASIESYLQAYQQEAVALSILTEPSFFGGSPELFASLREQTHLPLLWKDFVIDPFQIHLAKSLGANGILLIVKLLEQPLLESLYQETLALGLSPVIEVQNEEDVQRALSLNPQPELVLINHRDLNTLQLDMGTTARLASKLPENILIIAASGIQSPEDIIALKPYAHTFLIGSSLMRTAIEALPLKLKALKQ
jgi:indole-3-glycerol phosphate synthase